MSKATVKVVAKSGVVVRHGAEVFRFKPGIPVEVPEKVMEASEFIKHHFNSGILTIYGKKVAPAVEKVDGKANKAEVAKIINAAKKEAEGIIAAAKEEAEGILNTAKAEAADIKEAASKKE